MRGVRNPEQSAALEAAKRRLEEDLRAAATASRHGGLSADRVLRAYVDYYRARGKTYQVKAQRDSVALKGKPIPRRAALVEAMFMAELANLILTAGHDLDAMTPPLRADVTADGDRYILLNGAEAVLERGDMMMPTESGSSRACSAGRTSGLASPQRPATCCSPPTRPPASAWTPFEITSMTSRRTSGSWRRRHRRRSWPR